MEINRDYYLWQLIEQKDNGMKYFLLNVDCLEF